VDRELANAQQHVVMAALSLAASELWSAIHPEDAHAADEVDMRAEQLDTAIGTYATLRMAELERGES
jgi:hypothetical protein